MIDWKRSLQLFQLFARIMGMMGFGALMGLALLALRGPFTVENGYLPLLGALTAGALAVGVRITIDGLRKP